MDVLSRGDLLPKIVEAYSRPTRIVRGKDIIADIKVDEAAFETDEERALWSTFLSLRSKIHPDGKSCPPMYYSSLLSQDFSLDDSNLLDEFSTQNDVSILTPENESNKKAGRKGNYSIDEYVLVSGWLNVSMDPIQGNDQKHGRYWERVHEYKNFESERNSTALAKRFSTIQLAVNKFCGYYASIERMQQSGVGEQDKEDEKLRKNRLALLQKIADLPKGIVDLSVLPGFRVLSSF